MISEIKRNDIFALNCTGSNLGRTGEMRVMTISTQDCQTFVLDMKTLKDVPKELHSILQDQTIKKLMFNCRSSADSLYHNHRVNLSGIIDMQLIQYILENGRQAGLKLPSLLGVVETIDRLKAMELYDTKLTSDHDLWIDKIDDRLLGHVVMEIEMYFLIYKNFRKEINDIEELSTNYANSRIKQTKFDPENPYLNHHLMPLNILTKCKAMQQCKYCSIVQESNICIVCEAVNKTSPQDLSYVNKETSIYDESNSTDFLDFQKSIQIVEEVGLTEMSIASNENINTRSNVSHIQSNGNPSDLMSIFKSLQSQGRVSNFILSTLHKQLQ